MKNILFLDTETTGLPANMNAPYTDTANWPRLVQLAWQKFDETGKMIEQFCEIVCPDGFEIPETVTKIHGITQEKAEAEGADINFVIEQLEYNLFDCNLIVCHNVAFDKPVVLSEYQRLLEKDKENWGGFWAMKTLETYCTKEAAAPLCRIPNTSSRYQGQWKWPSLDELHFFLFNEPIPGREHFHGAMIDVRATARCYFEMQKRMNHTEATIL